MSQGVSNTVSTASVRLLLRSVGRMAIWTVLVLLLVKGFGAVLAPRQGATTGRPGNEGGDLPAAAFAVRFARTYLANPSPRALAPFLAEGAEVAAGHPPVSDVEPAQAEVSATEDLGGGLEVLTVACELRDARTLFLAVPIVRSGASEVAALGAPSVVAGPDAAGTDPERSQPLAGSDAAAIDELVARFIPAYFTSSRGSELAYLLAPGASVRPLAGAIEFESISSVGQLGTGEGSHRTVLATVRASDPASRASYSLVYRLDVVKHGRWYLDAVEGALS